MKHDHRLKHDHRRQFLCTAAAGSAVAGAALVSPTGLNKLLAGNSEKPNLAEDLIRYRAEIEPYVQLIEDTPREKCFDAIVDKINLGLPYRHLMAALFLAGIRNIDSSHVGGNLHTIFVVHSAHQLGLDSSVDQRLLPMFWSLDYFKQVQERGNQSKRMKSTSSSFLNLEHPLEELEKGCLEFDVDRIERSLVTLVRTRGAAEVAEPLWRLAARDFIPLGHKAIYMANAWRTLQTIGWEYAEPTLRSLAQSLASYNRVNQSRMFTIEKQCYNQNWILAQTNVTKLPGNWASGKSDPAFVKELVQAMRTGNHFDAATLVTSRLVDGSIQANSVWDAIHLAAGEIVLRQATIGSMHGVTAANALHYGFTQAFKPDTRLLLLLQGVGFVCHFIPFLDARVESRGTAFPKRNLLNIEPTDIATNQNEAISEVLQAVSSNPGLAASRALKYASQFDDHRSLLRAARRLVYAKGTEAHRYKFAAAIFEDMPLVSPQWRPQMLAAATQYFCGPSLSDSPVMRKAKTALQRLG